MYFIYALLDPITKQIRYIGKTDNLRERFYTHCHSFDKTHKSNWIKKLISETGQLPLLRILERVEENEWAEREKYWIARAKAEGYSLTNLTIGGESVMDGRRHTSESRLKMRLAATRHFPNKLGAKLSPESCRRISVAKLGKPSSLKGIPRLPETIEKMRVAMLGRNLSENTKEKLRISSMGHRHSEETKAKIGAARSRQVPPMLGKKHSEVTKWKMRKAWESRRLLK